MQGIPIWVFSRRLSAAGRDLQTVNRQDAMCTPGITSSVRHVIGCIIFITFCFQSLCVTHTLIEQIHAQDTIDHVSVVTDFRLRLDAGEPAPANNAQSSSIS